MRLSPLFLLAGALSLPLYTQAGPHSSVEAFKQEASQLRDQQNWSAAIDSFKKGIQQHPSALSLAVGLTMTLADAGNIALARKEAQRLQKKWPHEPDTYIAAGYVELRDHKPYARLALVDKAYSIAPQIAYVQQEYITALQGAGMPVPASEIAEKHPDLLTSAQKRELKGDVLAERTRLASITARPHSTRFDIADRVLAEYARTIAAWQDNPDARQDIIRLRLDRLSALHARKRYADVVQEYEALIAQGVRIPDYSLSVVASSYLTLREPETAIQLYQRVLQTPEGEWRAQRRADDEIGLYYALLESGRYEDALSVIAQANERQPVWLYIPGQPERVPNPRKLDTAITQTMAYYALDDLQTAESRIDVMVEKAPNNTALRTARATVYRARGWPRAAERDLQMAQTMTPRALDVEAGQAYTALQLQEWQQADMLISDLVTRYPEEPGVQALERDWQIHQRPELRIEAYRGLASDNPAVGNRDWGFDSAIYTSPFKHNWRAFAGIGQATASFDDENIDYRWQRAGLQWRAREISVEAELSANRFGHGVKTGARLQADFNLNDYWQLGLSGTWLSRETPLRALKDNIRSNSAGFALRWAPHERTSLSTGLTYSRYTDGNRRLLALVMGRQRVFTQPNYHVDATLDISFQRNTLSNANYFNPRNDLTVVPGLSFNQTLHRRYDTHWRHFITLAAGTYTQKGYGTGALFSVGYGQRLSLNKVLDAGLTVTGASRPYDGAREKELRIQFDLNYRF
ncbi:poly-beta-1,6 N-acetyl-D-glucosamine export porin PgaA [Pusillimonas sp. DMV24BSW_D]|uniref:poly-beta-1,6 N-acetyl-D-glucosamine export porin PgaA n=1 Tax=Neopusillimonas aestuarii TaxID=2716226 RepID=UPI00140CF710|nr:poly-beta-1,6 N-acetyl-D-glucosamine export porin PgaA [Pusillimonas sp. DMV24BSW_D]QIM47728.1 poly-beta-1,6 N-acetyl-D-glucosamine export porin PgaA [Pusillimonas sp. DMV24BSW_D]